MSQTYFAILTAVGEAKLANATALGTQVQISRMAVGDGNGNLPVPNRLQTALVRETYRADLNEFKPDPANASQIIAELVIPETEGGYWLREMGLYDEAGDLLAVANCPPSYKPQMSEGSGRTQVLRMVLIVSSTSAVQLKIDPSVVLATRAYADSLISVHMAAAHPHPQYQLRGPVVSLTTNTTITEAQLGLVLLDASGGNRTFTLPAAAAGLGVREVVLRRTDISANALVLAANGTDKLMLDTSVDTAGQGTTELLFAGDYLRLRSDGAGKWWCIGQAELPAGIASGFVKWDVAGTHTFNVPPVLRAGRRRARAIATGAGGSGSRVNTSSGGGGGAGATGFKALDLTGIASVPITVGAGGTPTASGATGSPGGASSVGVYMTANGGSGSSSAGQGGGGATNAVGADFVIPGNGGENRGYFVTETSSNYYTAGGGGGSYWGGGARSHGVATVSAGYDGFVGGGGSGSTGPNPAGRGGDGVVFIEWS